MIDLPDMAYLRSIGVVKVPSRYSRFGRYGVRKFSSSADRIQARREDSARWRANNLDEARRRAREGMRAWRAMTPDERAARTEERERKRVRLATRRWRMRKKKQ